MAEIRDGTIRDVLEKLRRLSYEIEETISRFDVFACTAKTLYELRVNVYRHEEEMVGLRRQVE